MKKLLAIFICVFATQACIASTPYTDNVYKVDEVATATAPWKAGAIILEDKIACEINGKMKYEHCPAQRFFLGISAEGNYLVQDFFKAPDDEKYAPYSAPYAMNDESAATRSNHFRADPKYMVGEYKGWHLNGQIREQWKSENGKLEGEKIQWFSNGQKESEDFYQNGELRGTSTNWSHFSYKKSLEYACDFERTQCTITSWGLSTGAKTGESFLVNGKKEGSDTQWYDYCPEQIMYQIHYANDVRHGTSQGWYPDGTKRYEEFYDQGEKTGVWTEWHRDGTVKSQRDYSAKDKRHLQEQHYPSGEKMEEIHYQGDVKNGLQTFWYLSGQKWSEVEYKNGLREGKWLWWHPNGQLKREEYFEKGIRQGVWLSWDDKGNLTEEIRYHNGLPAKFTDEAPLLPAQAYEIDQAATQQARWKVGAVVEEDIFIGKVGDAYFHGYRVFMGVSTQPGFCVVQEFYKEVQSKYSDPFLIYCDSIEKAIYNSGELIYGTYIRWHPNGQRDLETTYQPEKPFESRGREIRHSERIGISRAWNDRGIQISEVHHLGDDKELQFSVGANSLTEQEALELGMQEAIKHGWVYEKIHTPSAKFYRLDEWSIFFELAPRVDEQGREFYRVGGHGSVNLSLDGETARYTPGH